MSLFNKPLQIAMRTDASFEIGAGHVMRCLTLADNLKQHDAVIRFICQRLPGDLVEHIIKRGYEVTTTLQSKVDWLIVDHYGLDKQWENKMRTFAKRIMVVDDLANREHDCDLLLDQTLGRKPADYDGLVPKDCHLLLGTDYAIIAAPFAKIRSASLQRRTENDRIKHILVSLGGTDPHNVTQFVCASLRQLNTTPPVKILLGKQVEQASLAAMMADADVAIGAGGATSWERCCVGLPTIMIATASNQLNNAAQLSQAGAVDYLGEHNKIDVQRLIDAVRHLIKSPLHLKKMSAAAAAICDGYGIRRVVLELLPQFAKDGSIVRLRRTNINDAEIMLTWQQDVSTRQFARNPKPPTRSEHFAWLEKRLSNPGCIFNIILYRNHPVGVLRLDKIANTVKAYEISILTSPDYRRLGLAGAALRLIRTMFPKFELRATVLPDNYSSHNLFRNEGYRFSNGVYVNNIYEMP